MVTRRCTQRQFLLLPSNASKVSVRYALAMAQRATGAQIHVVCVLSNHYHIILSIGLGLLPEFVYILNKYIAKCMNAHYGRWENLFAAGVQASYVRCEDEDAIVDKSVYSITNPVKDGLVRRSEDWPGVLLWRPNTYVCKRPSVFFQQTDDPDGPCPPKLPLVITPPPLESFENQRGILEHLGREVYDTEREVRRRFRAEGRRFLGVERILAQHHTDTPTSREPRRRISPQVASRDKWRRVERLQQNKEFVRKHGLAMKDFADGDHNVLFPAGTYLMRKRFNVRCAEP